MPSAPGGEFVNASRTVRDGSGTTLLLLSPAADTINVGETTQLTLSTTRKITWKTSNATVATVDLSGLVTGAGPGTATITAVVGGQSATSEVTVRRPQATSVVVTPNAASMVVGGTVQLSAQALAGDVALTGVQYSWRSTDPALATVTPATVDGSAAIVTGAGPGTPTIYVSADGVEGSTTVTVAVVDNIGVTPSSITMEVGTSQQLSAVARDAQGNQLNGVTFSWQSDNEAVVTVATTSGYVLAGAPGTATITATGGGASGTATITVVAATAPEVKTGMWIGSAELNALPASGLAWDSLKARADSDCGTPDLSNQDQNNNVCIMAKALVFARVGGAGYRDDVLSAIRSVVNSGTYSGRALSLGRELAAYVISADLVGLATLDPTLHGQFVARLRELRTTFTSDGPANLVECHEVRPNNWGTHCGASRIAVDIYIGDTADLDRAAQVFLGWLGDRSKYAGFSYGETSWQCDPAAPVGINPAGCLIQGHNVDGVLPDDQRRAGSFTWPPPKENYVYEALQGALAQAVLLSRRGYRVWDASDRALLRAFVWLHEQDDFPATGDDRWEPHLINKIYGTSFPAPLPSQPGKNVGWTEWTHQ